jgi:hypothetical protein
MQATYPEQPEREFGPWGLSFATDRWDLRRTLVLELSLRSVRHADQTYTIVYYLDLQTLHPLYYVSRDGRREIIDVGTFAGRWSEDRPDYPRWPDNPERPVRVIDSAATAFANIDMRGSWRRESWEMVALPPSDETLRAMVSVGELTKRR